ncbi:MAG: PHP domain-containing protein [Chloroflexota bacterium]
MRPFPADLHVHSVLSPCADDLMLPQAVVATAQQRGLAIIGIVDHNSAENAAAFVAAAQGTGLTVIPGLEVTSREEVHVLTLFASADEALEWQEHIYRHLPPLANDERAFGTQIVVDADDEMKVINERLLITATDLALTDIVDLVAARGGLAIPAHVDRTAFGLFGQLGFLPPDLKAPAFEVSRFADPSASALAYPSLAGKRLLQSSDAHFLAEIGVVQTVFWLEEASFAEVRLACLGLGGRGLSPSGR